MHSTRHTAKKMLSKLILKYLSENDEGETDVRTLVRLTQFISEATDGDVRWSEFVSHFTARPARR